MKKSKKPNVPRVVETSVLADFRNPFEVDVWGVGIITKEGVQKAILAGDLESTPWNLKYFWPVKNATALEYHEKRVAFLVVNGWKDSIKIELPETWCFNIFDGHHRLAAAIYLNKPKVRIQVSGYVDYARSLFMEYSELS